MTTAFVLSGGGSLGAVQVGMLAALSERGFEPDLLVGASAGALNAAFIGDRGLGADAIGELASIWSRLRRQDVFPFSPQRQLLALAGARPSLCSGDGLRRLVDRHLTVDRLEDLAIPTHVVVTDVLSGHEVLLSDGDARDAVVASASIPAILPSVTITGRPMFDGGVADNTPVSQAVALGADRIVVLPAGVSCALPSPPRSAIATAIHALTMLIERRLALDVATFHDQVDLIVLPPLCPVTVSSADFRHADVLVERAHHTAGAWLDAGNQHLPHPERFLALHDHPGLAPIAHACDAA
jgi:NTE family protein